MKQDIQKWREVMALLNERIGSIIEEFEVEYDGLISDKDILMVLNNMSQLGFKRRDESWHPPLDWRYRN